MGVYLLCAELAPLLAKTRKLWKQSALSRGEEVSSIPFPQLRNSFCRVTRKVTYIIYGQKAGLACFWMTGSRTKRKKKIEISQLTPKWKPPIMLALTAQPLCNLVLYWLLKSRLSLCNCHSCVYGFPRRKCIHVTALICLEICPPMPSPSSPQGPVLLPPVTSFSALLVF